MAASWLRRRLDDDAAVGRGDVGVVGNGDGLDLVLALGVGDVDDPGVALAELDLADDPRDVVLLGGDVGGIGGLEPAG